MSNQSTNTMYFSGKKIRPNQVWKDLIGIEYRIASISPEESSVRINAANGKSFTESAGNLVAACVLISDPAKDKENGIEQE